MRFKKEISSSWQRTDCEFPTSFSCQGNTVIRHLTSHVCLCRFDNLHPEEIVDTVSKHTHIILEEGPKVKTDPRAHNSFAYAIADAAQLASTSVTTVTPFTMSALKAGYKHLGGKVDDITIVTAIVVKDK